MPFLYNHPRRKNLRKELRNRPTKAEMRLWWFLRDKKFFGYKFRRQYGIGRYITDFYCPRFRLAIEVDGDSHFSPNAKVYDNERTAFFNAHDIRVIRFTNQQVLLDMEHVLEELRKHCV